MKKTISLIIIVTLTFFMTIISYASDSDVTILASKQTVSAGDTVTLTINLAETEDGIAGLQGKIGWKTEQLTYVSSAVGSSFTTLNFNDESTSASLGTFSVYGSNYITTGGTAFTVTFKVNSGVTVDTPIEINVTGIKAEYQTAGTTDIQAKTVNLTVAEETVVTPEEKNEPTTTTKQPTSSTTNTAGQSTTQKADQTTAKTELPKTGITVAIIFIICIIAIISIVSGKNYIQYLKDTKKQLK